MNILDYLSGAIDRSRRAQQNAQQAGYLAPKTPSLGRAVVTDLQPIIKKAAVPWMRGNPIRPEGIQVNPIQTVLSMLGAGPYNPQEQDYFKKVSGTQPLSPQNIQTGQQLGKNDLLSMILSAQGPVSYQRTPPASMAQGGFKPIESFPRESIENVIEKTGGWKTGMREQFDRAMLRKDVETIRKMLPEIPIEYAQRFSNEIKSLLSGGTSFGRNMGIGPAMAPLQRSTIAPQSIVQKDPSLIPNIGARLLSVNRPQPMLQKILGLLRRN